MVKNTHGGSKHKSQALKATSNVRNVLLNRLTHRKSMPKSRRCLVMECVKWNFKMIEPSYVVIFVGNFAVKINVIIQSQ